MSDLNTISYTLILCSVISLGIKAILPGGTRSALYGPMKFLTSLVLLFTLLCPLFSLLSDPTHLPEFSEETSPLTDTTHAQELILEKSTEKMSSSVRSIYPLADFSLEVIADENFVPTGIFVICNDAQTGKSICSFLEENYSILTTLETRKDDDRQ